MKPPVGHDIGEAPAEPSSPPPPSPDDDGGELLDDGQEEVFSRYEVEHGLIEHQCGARGDSPDPER